VSGAQHLAVLRLATRGSRLALAQAALAAAAVGEAGGPPSELVVVSTGGDRHQSTPVAEMTGQGWFTTEIEAAVLDGRADLAVHSAKDLPTALGPGMAVVALLRRADVRDALVSRDGAGVAALAPGATVASSSARRQALLAACRPDVRVVPIRGNVDTRLRKLDAGEVDALLLAAAGLDRLALGARISERLDPRVFVPAPAQGAIALEALPGSAAADAVTPAGHEDTALAVDVERAVLMALGGGCLLPLGVWARLEEDRLVVSAALAVDGRLRRTELGGDPAHPRDLADRVASALR
jgi:hydroxymethylbilane synthase